jgi:hypothetical protein
MAVVTRTPDLLEIRAAGDAAVVSAGGFLDTPNQRLAVRQLGIITTAAKNDQDSEGAIGQAIDWMKRLNREASEAMQAVGVHAATDVTGFGLLGHLRNVARASGARATIWLDRVPVLGGDRFGRDGNRERFGSHEDLFLGGLSLRAKPQS